MPITIKKPQAPVAAPSGWGLKDLVPSGISGTADKIGDGLGTLSRIGGGWASAEGGIPGATIGAGAEGLAEFLEGSLDWKHSPQRIGTEAAISAVPFGKVASGARLATAAAKTGALAGAGDVGRQWAEGDKSLPDTVKHLDTNRTLLNTLLGAVSGGIFNHLNPGAAGAAAKELPVVESSGAVPGKGDFTAPERQSIPSGGRVLSAGRALTPNNGVPEIHGLPATTSQPVPTTAPSWNEKLPYGDAPANMPIEDGLLADLEKQFSQGMTAADNRFQSTQKSYDTFSSDLEKALGSKLNKLPNVNAEEALAGNKMLSDATNASDDLGKQWQADDASSLDDAFGRAMDTADTRFASQSKTATENAKRDLIQRRRMTAGVEPSTSFSSSVSSTTPTGVKESMTTKFAPPKAVPEALNEMLGGKPSAPPQVVDEATLRQTAHPSFYDEGFDGLANTADEAAQRQSAHPSFYDDSADNLPIAPGKSTITPGSQSKLDAHASMATPEIAQRLTEASAVYNDPNATKEAKRAAGKELGQLRDMLEGKGKYAPKDQASGNPLKGEKGFANTEALLSTTLGAGGALAGYAADKASGDDPAWDGALEGGLAGLAAPHLPQVLEKLKASIDPSNIEQVEHVAKQFVAKLPQIERFGLLANPQGLDPKMLAEGNPAGALPAIGMNALAGPYGAVMMHAIKSILMGDPRGIPLLKAAWNPATFVRGWWGSADESWQALMRGEEGRASNLGNINPDSTKDRILAMPGQVMTMGDTYARKLLAMAGYSEEEARRATLTNTPGEGWKSLANFGKDNTLLQMMFPFRRTPVNMLEQGIQTLPLGRLTSSAPTTEMLVDQGLGSLAGVGSYALAANTDDDSTRRNVRRLVSNAAARYSLPSMLGYMAGDAKARGLHGKNAVINERNFENIFPLPSGDVPVDIAQKLMAILEGNAHSPQDFVPDALSMKPLRQWLGDIDPSLRETFGVKPPPARGIKIPRPARRGQ